MQKDLTDGSITHTGKVLLLPEWRQRSTSSELNWSSELFSTTEEGLLQRRSPWMRIVTTYTVLSTQDYQSAAQLPS